MAASNNGIPEPIRRLIGAHITSIEQLEVLILLRSTAPREWSAVEVSNTLSSSVMSIQDRLGDLAARGFLLVREAESQLLYHYAPETDEIERLIDGLANAYKERRLTVVNLIYARPQSDVKSFSDAFKLGRSRGDE
jgi:hypothetical protein